MIDPTYLRELADGFLPNTPVYEDKVIDALRQAADALIQARVDAKCHQDAWECERRRHDETRELYHALSRDFEVMVDDHFSAGDVIDAAVELAHSVLVSTQGPQSLARAVLEKDAIYREGQSIKEMSLVGYPTQQTPAEYSVRHEMARARSLFPSNRQLLHAFVEEAGEVTKAFLDLQQGKGSASDVREELIQAISTAYRLLEEGDPEFPEFVPDGIE